MLQGVCSPTLRREAETFSEHCRATLQCLHPKNKKLLVDYVVGKCFPKMIRRFEHSICKALLAALKEVPEAAIVANAAQESQQPPTPFDQRCVDFLLKWREKLQIREVDDLLASLHGQPDSTLYSKATALYFHHTLLKLCEEFRCALHSIHSYMAQADAVTPDFQHLRSLITTASLQGTALHVLLYSDAIHTYLSSIKGKLAQLTHPGVPASAPLESLDDDSELQAAASIPNTPIHDTYLKVLRLIVTYFRSAAAVGSYLSTRHYPSITLNAISPAHQGYDMLSWEDLLRKVIPNSPSDSPLGSRVTVESVRKAIEMHLEREAEREEERKKSGKPTAGFTSVYTNHFGPGTPLQTGDKFTGTLHCEACLAALMHLAKMSPQKLKDINERLTPFKVESYVSLLKRATDNVAKDNDNIVGVTKRCCPVCWILLLHLRKQSVGNLWIPKSHHTVYPCALPPWLSPEIMTFMLSFFMGVLMRMLDQFVAEASPRMRTNSARSIDSLASDATSEAGVTSFIEESHFD